VKRDALFFKRAGIKKIIGMTGFVMNLTDYVMRPLPTVPHEGDQLLARLADAGIAVPSSSRSGRYLLLSEKERTAARRIPGDEHDGGNRTWVAIGPGSKMPAKVWPKDRFRDLVQRLIEKYDIWPVVFGGHEDIQLGKELVAQWGRGSVAAGTLNIRESMAALERCRLYIGNDTGTLHMAVAMGVRCIGLYSARDYPGLWFPHGDGHIVFRHALPCEGCMLEICTAQKMACMLAIQVEEVAHAIDKTGRLERHSQHHDIAGIK
jgi:ADP-heptose:LPS heptosyltransferase